MEYITWIRCYKVLKIDAKYIVLGQCQALCWLILRNSRVRGSPISVVVVVNFLLCKVHFHSWIKIRCWKRMKCIILDRGTADSLRFGNGPRPFLTFECHLPVACSRRVLHRVHGEC